MHGRLLRHRQPKGPATAMVGLPITAPLLDSTIAHQKCIQRWRKRTEILFDEIPVGPDELDESPDDLLIRREQETEFMNLLNQLPLPQRSVLLLHFIEQFSLEEIGRITETPLGTVKSRLHYAKKSLRKLLEAKNENAA